MNKSLSEHRITEKCLEIYEALLALGYPELIHLKVFTSEDEILKYCAKYLQPTPSRRNLILWLIGKVEPNLLPENDQDQSICDAVWKVGAMPFSKHTKNLDYNNYVQGLLGLENSVDLIATLCTLAIESKNSKKAHNDDRFGACLTELIEDYESLVNTSYDPYGVMFPSAHDDLSDHELKLMSQQKLQQIQEPRDIPDKVRATEDFQEIFRNCEMERAAFIRKYDQIIVRIDTLLQDKSKEIKNWKSSGEVENRTIKFPDNLSQAYFKYASSVRVEQFSSEGLCERYKETLQTVQRLNDSVQLE